MMARAAKLEVMEEMQVAVRVVVWAVVLEVLEVMKAVAMATAVVEVATATAVGGQQRWTWATGTRPAQATPNFAGERSTRVRQFWIVSVPLD